MTGEPNTTLLTPKLVALTAGWGWDALTLELCEMMLQVNCKASAPVSTLLQHSACMLLLQINFGKSTGPFAQWLRSTQQSLVAHKQQQGKCTTATCLCVIFADGAGPAGLQCIEELAAKAGSCNQPVSETETEKRHHHFSFLVVCLWSLVLDCMSWEVF